MRLFSHRVFFCVVPVDSDQDQEDAVSDEFDSDHAESVRSIERVAVTNNAQRTIMVRPLQFNEETTVPRTEDEMHSSERSGEWSDVDINK